MIFPILGGVLSIFRAPATWALFLMNLFVFFMTAQDAKVGQEQLEKYLQDENFAIEQGYIYARYIESQKGRYPASLNFLSSEVLSSGDLNKRQLLAGMALRDTHFLAEALTLDVGGDQVAYGWWRKKFVELLDARESHPSYGLGVTQSTEQDLYRWITYQFTHSGGAHLIGNMAFFLIFASSLELVIGSLGLVAVYIFSGIFAALTFSLLNESSAIPLIGASGAVSGVMALFCLLLWNRGVRYMFFLLIPKRGYVGLVYLPAWVTLVLWFLSDLAGHLATPPVFGGVAYSAHLGGQFCGLVMGLSIMLIRRLRGQALLQDNLGVDTQPIFTRYI
jgi:membrane associated rhomboid family serine protease